MLVLSRRPGQKIVIGNEIEIEVISVSGDGVRIGISAPKDTSIHRYEVFAEIQEANRSAQIETGKLEDAALENVLAYLRPRSK